MWRLGLVIYLIASVVLTGVLMITSLLVGYDDGPALIVVSVLGFMVAIPASYIVSIRLSHLANN
jgi:hypothetical protein